MSKKFQIRVQFSSTQFAEFNLCLCYKEIKEIVQKTDYTFVIIYVPCTDYTSLL